VEGTFGFVDHLGGRASEDDGAGLAGGDTGEFDELEETEKRWRGWEEKGREKRKGNG
jgi:hypothetical protein